jgi:mannose-6-phosphate isomerase-like protein (cupin superfamily)
MAARPLAGTLPSHPAKEMSRMPKVSKDSAAQVEQHGPVEDRHEDLDGYTVNFVSFAQDIDATPLMKGLPDDSCQCPHWGYVIKGRLTFRFADHEEVVEAGDAFYLPPGHVPMAQAGSEYVQFSPSEDLRAVAEAMARNMQTMQTA